MSRRSQAELIHTWEAFQSRQVWAKVIRKRPGEDNTVAEEALAELPEVTALEALRANAELVARLTGTRWMAMRAAREAGASWSEIGGALGMSKQGALYSYRRKIAEQEQHAGELHDVDRARG